MSNVTKNSLQIPIPQFIDENSILFTTGDYAIGFDLINEKEIFKKDSEGQSTTYVDQNPIIFKENKVYLDDQEISTYHDASKTQTHLSLD